MIAMSLLGEAPPYPVGLDSGKRTLDYHNNFANQRLAADDFRPGSTFDRLRLFNSDDAPHDWHPHRPYVRGPRHRSGNSSFACPGAAV